jgi:hypothetical protein
MDIHRGAVKPFAQAMNERLIITLAEFSDHLRDAARREVMGQAGDDSFLDIFSGPAAIAKADGVEGRGHEWGIRRNQVEAFATHGFEKIADHNFEIGDARGLGVEARATGRARVDIGGKYLVGVSGSE